MTLNQSINLDEEHKYKAKFSMAEEQFGDIYNKKDPIDSSLNMRFKNSGGYISEVVRLRNMIGESDKFFFKLRLKGKEDLDKSRRAAAKKMRLHEWRQEMKKLEAQSQTYQNSEQDQHAQASVSENPVKMDEVRESKKKRKHAKPHSKPKQNRGRHCASHQLQELEKQR